MFKSKFFKSYGMPIVLLLSILIGALLGIVVEDTSIFKPFGDIFLNLMYTIVVPLVFFTISSSIEFIMCIIRRVCCSYFIFFNC